MKTFEWTRWSGARRTVQAETVYFEASGHVSFWVHDRLVLAERREDVNELREVDGDPS